MMNQAMTERVDMLEKWIQESNNVVFFGGAGVSTESGIPDFRSVDGLYNQQYDYPPETIISHSFYRRNPEEFYRFYKNKMLFPNAKPNAAHLALAKLEQQGKVRAVITRTLTGCIRQQEAGKCWSCMALSTGITVPAVENSLILPQLWGWRVCRAVSAAALSSRMWYFMRKDWIRPRCRKRCVTYRKRIS